MTGRNHRFSGSVGRTDCNSAAIFPGKPYLLLAVWLFVLIPIAILAVTRPLGRDAKAYGRAVTEVRAGLSPYALGMVRLRTDHAHPTSERTMNYIYPPVTLPLLRAMGWLPAWLRVSGFWLLYAAGTWIVLRMEQLFFLDSERKVFALLTPLSVFFPGLLYDDSILAGNVAPVLYGLVAAAGMWDWKRKQWRWFYLAVLFASALKPPMLTLLAIPVLTTAGYWLRTAGVGALGCAVFFLQRFVWPDAFHSYTRMMDMEFLYNHEFGFSPAGQLGEALLNHHLPYQQTCMLFYISYAAVLFLVLLSCSRAYLSGRISAPQWLPVLLIGVILLNPRIKQYEAAIITLPMALVAWRGLSGCTRTTRQAVLAGAVLFLAADLISGIADAWDRVETAVTVSLFLVSAWHLQRLPAAQLAARAPAESKLEAVL